MRFGTVPLHTFALRLAGASFLALSALSPTPGAAQAAETLTFASWGGSYQEAQTKALLTPTAKTLGVTFKEATHKGLAEVRSQVLSGAVEWDIVDLGATDCAQGAKEGLFEPLDYSVINGLARKKWRANF